MSAATGGAGTNPRPETCSIETQKKLRLPIMFGPPQDFSYLEKKKIKLNELIVCFPHNGTTHKSHNISGKEIMARNQLLTITQYLDFVQFSPITGIDIDITKLSPGKLTSAHGAQRVFGYGGICDASNTDTKEILDEIFNEAYYNPKSIIIIRSENNNGTNEADILNLLDSLDSEKGLILKERKRRDLIFSFNKGEMPTYDDVIKTGKNILIFLEKNEDKDFDPETGLYPEKLMMAQKCFMARTKWDNVANLLDETKPIETSMVNEDFKYLPQTNFFIMIDYYTTNLGAKYEEIIKLHSRIFENMNIIYQRINEYFVRLKYVPPSNYMFMVDMISPEIIIESIDKNTHTVTTSICDPIMAISLRSQINKEKYFPQNAILDGVIGYCKSIFSKSKLPEPNLRNIPSFKNIPKISEKNLNLRKGNWTLKKHGYKLMNNNFNPNKITKNTNSIGKISLHSLSFFERLKKSFKVDSVKKYIEKLVIQYNIIEDDKEKMAFANYILSIIDLNDKAELILKNDSISAVEKDLIRRKLYDISKEYYDDETERFNEIENLKKILRTKGISIGGNRNTRKFNKKKHNKRILITRKYKK